MLERTKALFTRNLNKNKPIEELINILYSAIELLSLPDNDFNWSSWVSHNEAVDEIDNIITKLQEGEVPDKIKLSLLFGATGSMQEVSLSIGWGDAFIKLSDKYDEIEKLVW
jgi:hypothetical protein